MPGPPMPADFNARVLRYEARLIREALRQAEGSVTHAATLLGLHHTTLSIMLRNRHSALAPLRSPYVPRLRSIMRPRQKKSKKKRHAIDNTTTP